MDVEFFFDPVCTWSWVTSRWLLEVAPRRGLHLYWRSFSKLIGLGTQGLRDWDLTSRTASHRALRVMEAIRIEDPEAIPRLYEAMIARAMVEHAKIRPPFSDLPATLEAAGLDTRHAAAAYDERWDDVIRKSMSDVYTIVGEGARTPVTVLWLDGPVGFQGPLISPAPTGSDALDLWDSLVRLAGVPGVFEISRPRPPRPQMSPAWSSLGRTATPPWPCPDGR
jgi:2-hydroxychromene-2-carboxylate isomerase